MTAVLDAPVVVTEPGVYDLPAEIYHADPVPTGSLSCSSAKKLLPPSCPAIFDYERSNPPEPKKVFDIGHAAHKLALGIGPELVVVDANDWRTNAAKAQSDEAHAEGKVPLLKADYESLQAMADALRAHPLAGALLGDGGQAESSLFWTDPRTGLMLRRRLDWQPTVHTGRMIGWDYKTAVSANPEKFAKTAGDYGYDMAAPWSLDGLKALGFAGDDAQFVYVVQEKTPPYLVSVVQLDSEAMRVGARRNRQAIDIYQTCVETGRWPGYSDDVALVSLPEYFTRQFGDVL